MLITNVSNNKCSKYSSIFIKMILMISIISIASYVKCYQNGKCYRYNKNNHLPSASHGSSCFDGNAIIKLIDGNETKISDIKIGDKIWGWNKYGNYKILTIEELKIHKGEFQLYNLKLIREKKEIYIKDFITAYHPIRMQNNKWCSIYNKPSDKYYNSFNIEICKINDIIFFDNKEFKIKEISNGKTVDQVYDIETIGDYNSFEIESVSIFDRR